ncbi:hypothetical protein V5G24_02255 [Xanthobacter sp. VTT E-85241]|uniref:hypothetical protein n=1 Tax=Roseixanthobacter finlandensis TaxID=3119922 RepID=UPI003726CC3B
MSQSAVRSVAGDSCDTGPVRRSAIFFYRLGMVAAVIGGLGLGACATTPSEPPPPAAPQYTSPIPAASLVGRYGLAAYHRPEDAARTETQARAQCSNPYVITAGPNGGVMMYLADDNKLTELVSKAAGGPTFIGPPEDPAGGQRDRQVLRWDGQVLVLKWVDPEVSKRYGTMVYVRCS